jgi:Putative polyhydroxyalkanoic acid system protein (PHA_gran_rgn)
MANPIVVTIPHDLGRVEALRWVRIGLVRAIAALVGKIQVEQTPWTEDGVNLTLKALGQSVSALISVGDHFVRVEGTLPFLLSAFGEKAKAFVEQRGTLLLSEP